MDYQLRDLLVSADDHMVAGRAIDGDVDAFAVLIERYSPMMRACVHRMLNSNRDVDDIVQESFLVAWQQLDSLQDPGKVKSWLMRIASRRTIDRMRKTDREQAGLQGIEIEVPAHEAPEHVVESAAKLRRWGKSCGTCRKTSVAAGCCGRSEAAPIRKSRRNWKLPYRRCVGCWREPGSTSSRGWRYGADDH